MSRHVSDKLRKAKTVAVPEIHQIKIGFEDEAFGLQVHQRHPRTTWLHWPRNCHELEALDPETDNTTQGEFSVQIALNLQAQA